MWTWDTEFRDFDENLTHKAGELSPFGFVDASWHNDVCPKFRGTCGERVFLVFVDYADEGKREYEGFPRFQVSEEIDGQEDKGILSTNEWSEVIKCVAVLAAERRGS